MKKFILCLFQLFVFLPLVFSQSAAITANKSYGCEYAVVSFDGTSSNGVAPLTYIWDFNNGNDKVTEGSGIRSTTFIRPGVYDVELIVEDANGNQSSPATYRITIYDNPEADFSFSNPTTGCAPLNVSFSDNSTAASGNSIVSYTWEFGDGNSSSEKNPENTYEATGNFSVSLKVTDDKGCTGNVSKANIITTTGEIRFDIEADNTFACDPNATITTKFKPGLPYKTDLTQYDYHWDFGGGNTSSLAEPTATFTQGSHDVSLTISTKDGLCNANKNFPGFINIGADPPDIFYHETYPKCGMPRHSIELVDFGVGENQMVVWDFGDGQVDTTLGDSQTDHQYRNQGTYHVAVAIHDPNDPSCVIIAERDIDIDIPSFQFTSDVQRSCATVPITFSPPKEFENDLYDVDSYLWYFGDGSISPEKNPTHTYASDGTYDVTLNVITRKAGCKHSFTQEDFIHIGAPEVTFSSDGREIQEIPEHFELSGIPYSQLEGGCLSDAVNFTAHANPPANIEKYIWDFGDGNTQETTSPDVSYNYTTEGEFSPSVTVMDNDGCIATWNCDSCVRRGEKRNTEVEIVGDDTVCCTYLAELNTLTPQDQIDLVWYHVKLIGEEAGLPPMINAFYKEAGVFKTMSGNIASDINWEDFFLTSYSFKEIGDSPDLNYAIYNNGCPSSITYPEFQHHRLPWGNFLYTPTECEPNVDTTSDKIIFDLNDPVQFQGDWLAEENYPLDSVVISIDPPVDTTIVYRRSEYGELNLADFQNRGLFPVIELDSSASGIFFVHTYLYDSDPADPNGFIKPKGAAEYCPPPGQACYDRVPVPIIKDKITVNIHTNTSVNKGCAPLTVDFGIDNPLALQPGSQPEWIFSNGQTAIGTSTTVTFTEPDTITYSLFGYDSNGCTIDSSIVLDTIVVQGTKAGFSVDSIALCLAQPLNNTVNIENLSYSSGNIVENKWTFAGKDTIINFDNFSYSFSADEAPSLYLQREGSYIVLEITDDLGCKGKDSSKIFLRNPKVDYTFGKRNFGCKAEAYLELNNYNLVGGYPPFDAKIHYMWHEDSIWIEKDLTRVGERVAHGNQIFIDPGEEGTYSAMVEIVGDSLGRCGVTGDTTSFTIQLDSIRPEITVNDTVFPCPPATVTLDYDSTRLLNGNGIDNVTWEIYDRNGILVANSELDKPTFNIDNAGYFDVHLFLEDESGCEARLIKDSLVFVEGLTGKIQLPSETVCAGDPNNYSATSVEANSFLWDFGEGSVYEGDSVQYAFQQYGTRVVSLIISSDDPEALCPATRIDTTIFVKSAPYLQLADTSICQGSDIILRSTSIAPSYSYLWNPGAHTEHTIITGSEGEYTLEVTDQIQSCTSYDTMYLTVHPLPTIEITANSPVCEGDEVNMTYASIPQAKNQVWKVNGTPTGNNESFELVINEATVFDLAITDINNCTDSVQKTIAVVEKPELEVPNAIICPNDSALVDGTPLNSYPYIGGEYIWYFEDDTLPDDNSGTIYIHEEGNYGLIYKVGACISGYPFVGKMYPLPDISQNHEYVKFCADRETAVIDAGETDFYEWMHSGEETQEVIVAEEGTYFVELTNEHGCRQMDSILVESRCAPLVKSPTAFIPNDEHNKEFIIKTYNVGEYELSVYNRWGEIIYKSNDPNDHWNGTNRGKPMPSGVYPYIIKYTGDNPDYQDEMKLMGSVTLIR